MARRSIVEVGPRGGKRVGKYTGKDGKIHWVYLKEGQEHGQDAPDEAPNALDRAQPAHETHGHVHADPRIPPVGTTVKTTYKGRDYAVTVTETGFLSHHDGQEYRSLSRLATTLADSKQNGLKFFGLLEGRGVDRRAKESGAGAGKPAKAEPKPEAVKPEPPAAAEAEPEKPGNVVDLAARRSPEAPKPAPAPESKPKPEPYRYPEPTVGSKYKPGMRATDIAKAFREDVKAAVKSRKIPKGVVLSVRSDYYSMGQSVDVTIREAPFQVHTDAMLDWLEAGDWNAELPRPRYTPEATRVLETLTGMLKAYQRDASDSMTDYYDVNFAADVKFDEGETRKADKERRKRQSPDQITGEEQRQREEAARRSADKRRKAPEAEGQAKAGATLTDRYPAPSENDSGPEARAAQDKFNRASRLQSYRDAATDAHKRVEQALASSSTREAAESAASQWADFVGDWARAESHNPEYDDTRDSSDNPQKAVLDNLLDAAQELKRDVRSGMWRSAKDIFDRMKAQARVVTEGAEPEAPAGASGEAATETAHRGREDYEDRRKARIERLEARAAKKKAEAEARFTRDRERLDRIPMGQPILRDHYSAKRHRSDLAKSDRDMRAGLEAQRQAEDLARRAASAETSTAVSSDDPEAVVKLRSQLDAAERTQEHMRAANRIYKSKGLTDDQKITRLKEMGIGEAVARQRLQKDFAGRIGYADYELTNNSANIRRIKQRIEDLEKRGAETGSEIEHNGMTIRDNVEANRLQIEFPGKPDEETRSKLKRAGFRWSPSEGAWQRMRSNQAMYQARKIVGVPDDVAATPATPAEPEDQPKRSAPGELTQAEIEQRRENARRARKPEEATEPRRVKADVPPPTTRRVRVEPPEDGKTYALTGGPGEHSIAGGSTWAESEVGADGKPKAKPAPLTLTGGGAEEAREPKRGPLTTDGLSEISEPLKAHMAAVQGAKTDGERLAALESEYRARSEYGRRLAQYDEGMARNIGLRNNSADMERINKQIAALRKSGAGQATSKPQAPANDGEQATIQRKGNVLTPTKPPTMKVDGLPAARRSLESMERQGHLPGSALKAALEALEAGDYAKASETLSGAIKRPFYRDAATKMVEALRASQAPAAEKTPKRAAPGELTADEQAQRQAAAEESARRRRKPQVANELPDDERVTPTGRRSQAQKAKDEELAQRVRRLVREVRDKQGAFGEYPGNSLVNHDSAALRLEVGKNASGETHTDGEMQAIRADAQEAIRRMESHLRALEVVETTKPETFHEAAGAHHYAETTQGAEERARAHTQRVLDTVDPAHLADLPRGHAERLEAIKERMPAVYGQLREGFDAAGVAPHRAGEILADTMAAKGWTPEARASMFGAASGPAGADVAANAGQIAKGAANLASAVGSDEIGPAQVAAAAELRTEGGDKWVEGVDALMGEASQAAETLLAKIAAARKSGSLEDAKAALAAALDDSLGKLTTMAQAYPGLSGEAVTKARGALAELASVAPRKPGETRTHGAQDVLHVRGADGKMTTVPVRYRLVSADEAIASHRPEAGFAPNAAYPEGVQERQYHTKEGESKREGIQTAARNLSPTMLVNTAPDATTGAPIITPDGVVLGGNSRTMSLQLAYAEHPERAEDYKRTLRERAAQFGLRPEDVDAVSNPILVREWDFPERDTGTMKLRSRQLNETFVRSEDPRSMQAALARRVDDKAVAELAANMDVDETLGDFLQRGGTRAAEFVDRLKATGVVTDDNESEYATRRSNGQLKVHAPGARRLTEILVGKLIGDVDVLSSMRDSTYNAVTRAMPYVYQAEQHGAEYGIRDSLRKALSAYAALDNAKDRRAIQAMPKSDWESSALQEAYASAGLKGFGLFGDAADQHPVMSDPRGMVLLEAMIRHGGPKQMGDMFRNYARLAEANSYVQGRIGEEGRPKLTPEQVWQTAVVDVIERKRAEADKPKPTGGGGGEQPEGGEPAAPPEPPSKPETASAPEAPEAPQPAADAGQQGGLFGGGAAAPAPATAAPAVPEAPAKAPEPPKPTAAPSRRAQGRVSRLEPWHLKGATRVRASGNTYAQQKMLKQLGGVWNAETREYELEPSKALERESFYLGKNGVRFEVDYEDEAAKAFTYPRRLRVVPRG